MRVLMLSWEYPPRVVGGLGRHVGALARSMAALGHDVHVITRAHADDDLPLDEVHDGVHVMRVPDPPPTIPFSDLVPWVLAFNNRIQAAASRLLRTTPIDVIHAHDWLVAYAAIGLRETWDLPLVATIHATEYGRHQGHLPKPMNRLLHQVEGWLTSEAQRVITCSRYMRRQVDELFDVPSEHIEVVPNGVDLRDFEVDPDEARAFRATLTGPRTRMVLFAGRLVYEKGVQTVLDALERVRAEVGPTKLFVAGTGTYSDKLRERVRALGLQRHVKFTGFLADRELRLHYAAADVAVAPSIYEPFGLVAVEAMACGTPIVVGDTGGLREIVADGHGIAVTPEDDAALADALIRVLRDEQLRHDLVTRARARLAHRYDWDRVAATTVEVYARAGADPSGMRPPNVVVRAEVP